MAVDHFDPLSLGARVVVRVQTGDQFVGQECPSSGSTSTSAAISVLKALVSPTPGI